VVTVRRILDPAPLAPEPDVVAGGAFAATPGIGTLAGTCPAARASRPISAGAPTTT